MKGVTRVTASLLAAAMTAGLGTTAVLAAGGTAAVADPATDDGTVASKYIDVTDKDGHIVGTTDEDVEKYWGYSAEDKKWEEISNSGSGAELASTTVDIYLPVGSSKTLTAAVNEGSTATAKWSYKDVTPDGTIDDNDTSTDGSQKPVMKTVKLDNGTFTALEPGTVTFYAYPSDAATTKTDANDSTKKTTTLAAGEYVTVNVHVYKLNENTYTLKFKNHDTVYLADEVDDNIDNYDKAYDGDPISNSEFPKPNTDLTARKLSFKGSQLVNHASTGDSLEFEVTANDSNVRDDSDVNPKGIKFSTTSSKFITATGDDTTGTVSVVGTAPKSGLGRVCAYVDENEDGRFEDGEEVSNSLVVLSNTGVAVYRVYNPNSGEHLYTVDEDEVYNLKELGWKDEGTAWYAPETSVTPVHRVYNPVAGEHIYTTDEKEVANLVKAGWNDEGVKFYSASNKYYAVARQYNPNAFANNHNYTANAAERTFLVSLGWKDEGVKLYATEMAYDTLTSAANYADYNND